MIFLNYLWFMHESHQLSKTNLQRKMATTSEARQKPFYILKLYDFFYYFYIPLNLLSYLLGILVVISNFLTNGIFVNILIFLMRFFRIISFTCDLCQIEKKILFIKII